MIATVSRVVVAVLALLSCAACGRDPRAPTGASEPGGASVLSVTDGDTIRVELQGTSTPVRLIGIDTPETHGQGGLRECFGAEATKRTNALLPAGTEVRLVRDVEARDRYGRLLAYVYRAHDGLFVNLRLAEEGFAAALSIPPNVAHRDDFVAAAAEARDANRGLWGVCGGPDTPVNRIAPVPSQP